MPKTAKRRVYEVLEFTDPHDRASILFNALITVLIILSVASVILESVASINERFRDVFFAGEILTVAVFTVEYALRLWSCTEDPRFSRPVLGRLRWAVTFFAIIDLLSFLPFYLPLVVGFDARFLRALRLLRVLRVAKLGRYSSSVSLLSRVIKRQAEALVVAILTIVILIIVAASLMWHAEYEAQPQAFASIPDAMWWAVATVTTIGYGDVVPVTPLGKFLGGVIGILGVMCIALPAGIIVTGFMDERKEAISKNDRTNDALKRVELL
ncbi:MAG: potassium channel family protein, partial [Methanomassiliicoccales archaeon]|nr:potassium channel family protein [Methanomassiliicoccales archaeon]